MIWLYETCALLLSAAGVLAALLAFVARREFQAGLAMMLELWTAAGLLRLAADPGVREIASAAAIICLRSLLRATLPMALESARGVAGR
jgi:uncharacterized membrane protein